MASGVENIGGRLSPQTGYERRPDVNPVDARVEEVAAAVLPVGGQGYLAWMRGAVAGAAGRARDAAFGVMAGARDRVVDAVTAIGQGALGVGARAAAGARYYAAVAGQAAYDVAAPRLRVVGDALRARWDAFMQGLSSRYHAFDARRAELEAAIGAPLQDTVRMLADAVGDSIEETADFQWIESFADYLPDSLAERAKAAIKETERGLLYDALLIAMAKLLDRIDRMTPEQWQRTFDQALMATDQHFTTYLGARRDPGAPSVMAQVRAGQPLFAFPEGTPPEMQKEYLKVFFTQMTRQMFVALLPEIRAELPAFGAGLGAPSIAGYVLSFERMQRKLLDSVPKIVGEQLVELVEIAGQPFSMQTLVTKVSDTITESLAEEGCAVPDQPPGEAVAPIPIDVTGKEGVLGRIVLNLVKLPGLRRLVDTIRAGAGLVGVDLEVAAGGAMLPALRNAFAKGHRHWINFGVAKLNAVLHERKALAAMHPADREVVRGIQAENAEDAFVTATDRVAEAGVNAATRSVWERMEGVVTRAFSNIGGLFTRIKAAAVAGYRVFSTFYEAVAKRVYVLGPVLRFFKAFAEAMTMACIDFVFFILRQFRNHVLYSPIVLRLVNAIRRFYNHCSGKVKARVAARVAQHIRRGAAHLSEDAHSNLYHHLIADIAKGLFPEINPRGIDVVALHGAQQRAREAAEQHAAQEREADARMAREFEEAAAAPPPAEPVVADVVVDDDEFFEARDDLDVLPPVLDGIAVPV